MKPILFKGIGDILRISLPEGEWSDIFPSLLSTLDERSAGRFMSFFCRNRASKTEIAPKLLVKG